MKEHLLFLLCTQFVQGIVDPDEQEKRLAWKYLDCSNLQDADNRPVDWPDFRRHLLETPYPANMERVFDVLNRLSAAGSATSYDEEARSCLMGVPAAFFYLTRFTLETMDRDEYGRPEDADVVRKATLQYSVFENYISALHPGLINAGNWSFNDEQVFVLRKQILRAYRQLEAKKKLEPKWPFKVYVYDEEEVPQLQPLLRSQIYCSRGQWGTDVQVHDYFVTADFQTDDPKEADFFFVPGYAICVLEGNLYTLDEVDELYKELVPALPYFNASGGRDHIFVFGSGMAQSAFQSWEEYIPQSIVLTPETELFNDFAWVAIPPYRPFKDIVIPGSLDLIEVIAALEKSKPLRERRFLTAFFGRADLVRGPHPWVGGVDVRKELIALKDLPGTEDMKFGDGATLQVMHEAYGDAKFCFVPRGKSGWSLRFFEVIFAGCVPVMISDKWELPFEDFLDVTRFVIKWPSTQIGPQSEGRQLQAERQQARGLAQENQRLKKSLHDSEASVQSLRTQNLELEKEQRAWQKAEEESRKAAAILRQEVEKLREERQDLDRQVSNQERQSRRHHSRTSTLQPRPPDSGSSAHRSTVMEVDLRTEGKPQMEEKELEDSSSGSSNEYYEQEPPAHIKQRLSSLQQAARFSVRQDLR